MFIQAGVADDEAGAIADEIALLHDSGRGTPYDGVAVLLRCFRYGNAKTHMPLQVGVGGGRCPRAGPGRARGSGATLPVSLTCVLTRRPVGLAMNQISS